MMLFPVLSGCTPLIVAVSAGAVGGYAVSRDTFEGVTSKGKDELWDAAYRVASIMGTIESSDRHNDEIIARIQGARVTIYVLAVNLTTTKLRVKARKSIFPRSGLAQEVYVKTMNQLEQ